MLYYIVPLSNDESIEKYLIPSLNQFNTEDYELIKCYGEDGICLKYNNALDSIREKLTEDDVVIFLHDDITICDIKIKQKLEMYFKYKPNVGIAGVIGTTFFTDKGGWWLSDRLVDTRGKIIQGNPNGESYTMTDRDGMYDDLVSIDGCIMFMQGKLAKIFKFDSETFKHYHFYDVDACFTLVGLGYKIGIIDVLVEHASIGELKEQWHEAKNIFYKKWGHLQFPVKCDAINIPKPQTEQ